jgi:DNA helicase II / ATP-dependent DNA helicase PcrA
MTDSNANLDVILAGLTEPQREAVTHIEGPLLVLAGAGSGKTRTITRRIAYLVANGIAPWNVLAVTFTNKAAGEMRQRTLDLLRHLPPRMANGVTVSTFHSLCARLLREFAVQAGLAPTFNIADSADQLKLMKQAMENAGISVDHFPPARLLEKISSAKNRLQSAEQFAQEAGDFFERNAAKAYMAYDQLLRTSNVVDFDDLLLKTAVLLRDNAEVRKELQERFGYILIDEYQDTNHAQFVIAHMLAMEHQNICVTGDPDQSIYAWRGANLSNILEFEQFFPKAKVVLLEQNYRSTKTILKAASALIANNKRRKAKTLWTNNETGPQIQLIVAGDERQEAQEIVQRLKQLHDAQQIGWDRMAIFYRVNALTRVLEDALMKSAVPYQIVRGTEFYSRKEVKDVLAYLRLVVNPEDNVSLERVINVPTRGIGQTSISRLAAFAAQQQVNLLEACRRALTIEGLSKKTAEGCRSFAARVDSWRKRFVTEVPAAEEAGDAIEPETDSDGEEVFDAALQEAPEVTEALAFSDELIEPVQQPKPTSSVAEIMETLINESGMNGSTNEADEEELQRRANVLELINVAAEFDRSNPGGTLQDYLTQVTLVSDVDRMRDESGSVTLMTLHAAKGLEFPVVAIVGWEEGLLPHQRMMEQSITDNDMEEERRLAFVGITRAMKHLFLSRTIYRMIMGRSEARLPSRFVNEMPIDCFAVTDLTREAPPPGSAGFRDGALHYPRRPAAQKSAAEESQTTILRGFRRGSLVRHHTFGLGRIAELREEGERQVAVVEFKSVGRKTMILQFARLETVDG